MVSSTTSASPDRVSSTVGRSRTSRGASAGRRNPAKSRSYPAVKDQVLRPLVKCIAVKLERTRKRCPFTHSLIQSSSDFLSNDELDT